jgi:hypothetical protein
VSTQQRWSEKREKMETKDLKTRSAFRRSLMALAILAAPVISIAGFSGSASAAWDDDDTVTVSQVCTPDPYNVQISVTINSPNGGGSGPDQEWNVYVYQGSTVSPSPWLAQVKTDLANGGSKETSRTWLYEVPADLDGSYNVLVEQYDAPSDEKLTPILVSCSAPEDSFTAVGGCFDEGAGVLISVPENKPGNGPKNVAVIDDDPEASSFADGSSFFVALEPGATYKVQVKVAAHLIAEVTVTVEPKS